jgi:spermidine synthase
MTSGEPRAPAPRPATPTAALVALVSGAVALAYEVVWTRQVGLLAGNQIEAISVVLVVYFGGLALGAHRLGARADRVAAPLRLYARLEIAAAGLAAAGILGFRGLAANPQLAAPILLVAAGTLMLPVTFLLGGTLPALLRWSSPEPAGSGRRAGILVGANTVGAVLGVTFAVVAIPVLGLSASLGIAAAVGIGLGLVAGRLGRSEPPLPALERRAPPVAVPILLAAALVGAATLGFEVLAARLATLRLGSSLYAWGIVLGLFLLGLSAGNLALARRARDSATPALDLGWLEVAAAGSVGLGLAVLRPELAAPTSALTLRGLLTVAIAVLPATFCMGAAFPLLVRLAVREHHVGTTFGRVSAWNTCGGIAGTLLAPFVLLPALGSISAGLTLASTNAAVGLTLLWTCAAPRRRRHAAAAGGVLVGAFGAASLTPAPVDDPWLIFVREGRQATTVVTSSWGNRTLYVDGDPEAATLGDARRTEELLAILPLLLHPDPHRYLEIGLGSGITLGTATYFPLERIDCVEIAPSVVEAARFFEPDNRGVATREDVSIVHEDARRLLARRAGVYDVVSANTLHPWSIGATALYSREYFARIEEALRPGGIAVQWLPLAQITRESLVLILRTFYDVFPEGDLWWGAGNVIAVGGQAPIDVAVGAVDRAVRAGLGRSLERLGLRGPDAFRALRIADAAAIRRTLGEGAVLRDDRPLLELHAARGRVAGASAALHGVLVELARSDPGRSGMLLWLESLDLRARGEEAAADAREALAADLGLEVARQARLSRATALAHAHARDGDLGEALSGFDAVLEREPGFRDALLGRAQLAIEQGHRAAGIRDLEAIVAAAPEDARVWNELAGVYASTGRLAPARAAIDRALEANPFDVRTLANAGLIAVRSGDGRRARVMLERLRAISPLGPSAQQKALEHALDSAEGP